LVLIHVTTIMHNELKAPFPAFGGKSSIAPMVWARFGTDATNYVEPFCFSAAMLLARPPDWRGVETINDRNAYVANFWRAVSADPDAVARHVDWPVNEADLYARHNWLRYSEDAAAALQRVREDPDAFDARIAGWWCWGLCSWIGGGWCSEDGAAHNKRPHLGNNGHGVHRKVPNPTNSPCADRSAWLKSWMGSLRDRLRNVRVCCGHWSRCCDSTATLTGHGTTAVFLDPPYRVSLACGKANRTTGLYASDKNQDINALCDEVQAWCLKWGSDPNIRIALCGYEGEYPDVDAAGWSAVAWKANGGYGNRGGGTNANASRERVWFSPACLSDGGLF
jgi:site-specific DNA-adenine methylase